MMLYHNNSILKIAHDFPMIRKYIVPQMRKKANEYSLGKIGFDYFIKDLSPYANLINASGYIRNLQSSLIKFFSKRNKSQILNISESMGNIYSLMKRYGNKVGIPKDLRMRAAELYYGSHRDAVAFSKTI